MSTTSPNFRQSMSTFHTWTGLLPGWLLFLIFVFGSSAFFMYEISAWMRPELRSAEATPAALDAAGAYLQERAPGAAGWTISLPISRGGDAIAVSWEPREGSKLEAGEATLDPTSGKVLAVRDTRGGEFLYRFHFELHYMPWWAGRYIVSLAALAMLVALVSGIVTHKKIFADFFMLRFGKGQRSWLDAHNVAGVLAMPFHLMITYTGLVTLLFMLMPWAISANFPSEDKFYALAYPQGPQREASGKPAPVMPISAMTKIATRQWHGEPPRYISIANPGDANGKAELYPSGETLAGEPGAVHLDPADGHLFDNPPRDGAAQATADVMIDIHRGAFAGTVLRWLYFLGGLGGTAMVGTGLLLWVAKRRNKLPDPDRPHLGFRIVERLNAGVIGGVPIALASYFLANRLLPVGMAARADWEINILFIAWGGAFVWSFARPTKRAWVEMPAAAAALFALVPVINAITTTRGLLPSLLAGDTVFVAFDLAMLVFAALLAFAARRAAAHRGKAPPRRSAGQKPKQEIVA